jgi:hypothetical protein
MVALLRDQVGLGVVPTGPTDLDGAMQDLKYLTQSNDDLFYLSFVKDFILWNFV